METKTGLSVEWQRIYDLHTFCTNCTEFLTNFAENVHEVFQLVKDSFHSNMNEIFLRNKAYIEPSKYLCQSSNNIRLTYGSLNKILLSLRGTTTNTQTHISTLTHAHFNLWRLVVCWCSYALAAAAMPSASLFIFFTSCTYISSQKSCEIKNLSNLHCCCNISGCTAILWHSAEFYCYSSTYVLHFISKQPHCNSMGNRE